MTTVPELRDHLVGLERNLTTAANGKFGVHVSVAGKDPDNNTLPAPYAVVWPLPGGSFNGPVADPDADLELVFQLTCVAADPLEAAWVRDKATVGLLTTAIAIPGRSVMWIRPVGGPGPILPDHDVRPPLFYCTPQFRLATTPTPEEP